MVQRDSDEDLESHSEKSAEGMEKGDGRSKVSRLLTTIGNKKCAWGCIYCFVDNPSYSGLERIDGPDSQWSERLADPEFRIIQPSADVELSLVPRYGKLLGDLALKGKHVSFSTKARLTASAVSELKALNDRMMATGNILQVAVSILLLNDYDIVEPGTPSPYSRIETLKRLFEAGVPTSVAFRPMLPFLTHGEIDEIVNLTWRYTHAYLSGPLYMTPAIKDYMDTRCIPYSTTRKRVGWIPGSPTMEVVNSPELESHLTLAARAHGLPVFMSNVDLVNALADKFLS